MRIEIKPFNLSEQKIKSTTEAFLELHDNYIRYRMQFVADELKSTDGDEALGWEEKETNFDLWAKRECISSVEKWKCTNIARWKIIISVTGQSTDATIYFRTEGGCDEVFQKLLKYIFNGNQD